MNIKKIKTRFLLWDSFRCTENLPHREGRRAPGHASWRLTPLSRARQHQEPRWCLSLNCHPNSPRVCHFPHMCPPVPSPVQDAAHVASSHLPLGCSASSHCACPARLGRFRRYRSGVCRTPFNLGLSEVFSHDDARLRALGKNGTEVRRPSHRAAPGGPDASSHPCWCSPWSPGEGAACQVSPR